MAAPNLLRYRISSGARVGSCKSSTVRSCRMAVSELGFGLSRSAGISFNSMYVGARWDPCEFARRVPIAIGRSGLTPQLPAVVGGYPRADSDHRMGPLLWRACYAPGGPSLPKIRANEVRANVGRVHHRNSV